ncbi:MAG: leucine-rich repeat protein [Clostridia bacterium]|nr:leucine-rich repeat protein [Clostridia bacterium]
MDNEKKNDDLFSNIDLGNFSERYAKRTQDTERKERAKKADERIAEFVAQPKTLEWAWEALTFCTREAEENKDIADISVGIQGLTKIKREAEEIIENDRLAKEREAQERKRQILQKIQEEENARRAKINELDQMIFTLSQSSVSQNWCDEVEKAKKLVDSSTTEIRTALKNLPLLDKMQKSLKFVREGLKLSDRIKSLKENKQRDTAWATLVVEILDDVTDNNKEYVEDLELVQGYLKEALRIIRLPQIEEFDSFLKLVEGGVLSKEDINQYQRLSKKIKALSYDMEEYIDSFSTRWDMADSLVKSEKKRHAELERKQREEEEKRRLYEERKPIIEEYEEILVSIEAGKKNQAIIDNFSNLNFSVETQGFSLSEYIDNFDSRWSKAYKIVLAEKERLAEIERKQREEEEKRRIEQERQSVAKEFKDILIEVEAGQINQRTINRFIQYNSTVYSYDYLHNYISNFNTRWSNAHNNVLREQQRLADLERKQREEEERRILRERQPKIDMYKSCLDKVESEIGHLDEATMTRFETLDKESKYLGFSMWNYIYDFDSRWKKARAIVKEERLRISRKPDIDEYTSFLGKITMSNCTVSDLINKFDFLNSKLGWIGYKLSKYIPDFDIKWALASGKIEKEKQRARELEIEKEKKEAQERERKELAEIRKQKSLQMLKRVLIISAIVAGALAVLGGLVALLVFVEPSRHYVASFLICAGYVTLWTILRAKTEINYTPWYLFTSAALAIATIPMICASGATAIYGTGIALSILASAIGCFIFAWKDHTVEEESEYDWHSRTNTITRIFSFKYDGEYTGSLIAIFAGGVLFSIGFGCMFDGLAEALVVGLGIAVSFIATTILYLAFFRDDDSGIILLSASIVALIVAFIFALVTSYETIYNLSVCAVAMTAGVLIAGIIRLIVEKKGSSAFVMIVSFVVIFSGILSMSLRYPDSEVPVVKDGVLVAYTGWAEEFVVPDEVHTIGESAFAYRGPKNTLKRVILHDNVKKISANAFYGCYQLTEATIPGSVEFIDTNAFSGCTGLTSVVLEEGIKRIYTEAFKGCTALTTVTIPSTMESIGIGAFSHCKGITSVVIESESVQIGGYAFYECDSLGSIELPSSVVSIGEYAFSCCDALASIKIPSSVKWISDGAFSDCSKLKSVVVESGVSSIGNSAFLRCYSLDSVVLPSSVKSIEVYAFSECTSLTSIRLPRGLETIGDYAFTRSDKLSSVSMPASVTTFGDEIFGDYEITVYYEGSQSQWDKIEKDWFYWNNIFGYNRKVVFNQYK